MSELKRTVLYQAHLDAGATMVDFGGWDMPIQYPDGIVAEHLYCRSHCAIFDVSHMGRIDVEGPDMVRFLQHVLSSNVQALDINQASETYTLSVPAVHGSLKSQPDPLSPEHHDVPEPLPDPAGQIPVPAAYRFLHRLWHFRRFL